VPNSAADLTSRTKRRKLSPVRSRKIRFSKCKWSRTRFWTRSTELI